MAIIIQSVNEGFLLGAKSSSARRFINHESCAEFDVYFYALRNTISRSKS